MKKHSTIAILFTLFLLINLSLQAQSDSTAKSGIRFKISANYNSNLNYYGRTDSLRSSGFFPLAEVWLGKNFYVNAAPIFVNNKLQSMDYAGTVATVGYQSITDKWLTNMYVLRPFYEEGTDLAQSVLKAQSGITVSKLNKIVNITLGGDVKFSERTDFGATAGLDHLILISNKDGSALVFDPGAYAYAGTQNFSRTRRKNNSPLPLPGNQETENVQEFNILAFEFSMPVVYSKNKWQVIAVPSYILPRNLLQIPNRPDLSEQGKNTFYATVALKYSF